MSLEISQLVSLATLFTKVKKITYNEAESIARKASQYDRDYAWRMFYEKNYEEIRKVINELENVTTTKTA